VPEYDSYSLYHDLLWAGKQEDVPFYEGTAKETRGPALEPACGPGRVLLPLARAGFDVTGLDKEPHTMQARVALECAGFEVMAVYRGYDRRPYDHVSGIQLIVARAAGKTG